MIFDEDEKILTRVGDWLQSDQQNSLQDNLPNRIVLRSRHPAMIHRTALRLSEEDLHFGESSCFYPISPRFVVVNKVYQLPITKLIILDIYYGRGGHLCVTNKSSTNIPLDQNTIFISKIQLLDLDEPPWLAVFAILCGLDHYVCLAEFDFENANLILHKMDLVATGQPIPHAQLSFVDYHEVTNNKITLNILLLLREFPDNIPKEVQLHFSTNNGLPTMTIQEGGPDYIFWALTETTIINNKFYRFPALLDLEEIPQNYEELAVSNTETPSPYHAPAPQHILKIRGFNPSYNKQIITCFWHRSVFYAVFVFEDKTEWDLLYVSLETLCWTKIYTFKCALLNLQVVPRQDELCLIFVEKQEHVPDMTVLSYLILPISKPFKLIKLALLAMNRLDHTHSNCELILKAVSLPSSLKPILNSTKYQSVYDDEFQRFCATKP